jgi:hypothetical protein
LGIDEDGGWRMEGCGELGRSISWVSSTPACKYGLSSDTIEPVRRRNADELFLIRVVAKSLAENSAYED